MIGKRERPHSVRTPAGIALLAFIGITFFIIPLIGMLARTPWSRLGDLLGGGLALDALRLSITSSLAAVAVAAVLGIPLAWVLARVEFPGKRLVRGLVMLPMILPPVVGGALLLFAFGRRGLLGEPIYEQSGLLLPFSTAGVILANTFVAMPFLIISIEGALRGLDRRYEGTAATLGARGFTVIRRVTLPLITPSMAAGLVLTWARALGEFGATITFAGNLPGRTQTLPLAVFIALESDRDTAIALSLVLVAISFTVIVGLRDRWWRSW